MKPGEVVKLPNGSEGTVVYHGLDGYGIKWGRRELSMREIEILKTGTADLFRIGVAHVTMPNAMDLAPDAMLCMKCRWTGVVDTPYSGSDPSCPDCNGEGYREEEPLP